MSYLYPFILLSLKKTAEYEIYSCIWEIRDRRDGTVEIRSNADVELGIKYYRGKKVVMGKPNLLKESGWIPEPVE